jgi:hypothetical protein
MRHLRRLLIPLLAIPLCLCLIIGGVLAWVQWGSGAAALAGLDLTINGGRNLA